jgi:hypothetical protein
MISGNIACGLRVLDGPEQVLIQMAIGQQNCRFADFHIVRSRVVRKTVIIKYL